MNRSFRDYNSAGVGARYFPAVSSQPHHRRPNGISDDNNLDLFSRTRRSVSLAPSDESDVSMKLGKISVGSVKVPARSGLDDLMGSGDGGKNDYDWLLTPPETPICRSSERSQFQSNLGAPRNSSATRSSSTTKPSRLSTTQLDNSNSSRPARSSSVTRSSISSTLTNHYSSNRSPSSILNTSSASVSSYIRPSSPIIRSSTSRPSTPSSRTSSSRSSTPAKSRSTPTISSTDRARPSQGSRPSTPSSRPQIPANLSFPTTRSNSRPSTPTRRNSVSTSTPSLSVSTGRALSNGRTQTTSRPSSPSPRARPQQPIFNSDFPHDTPPNLRTSLVDRPISAGRSRPGTALGSKANNPESPNSVNLSRRSSSPATSRGRSVEPPGRNPQHTNGHTKADISEPRKSTYISDSMRKPVKTSTPTDNGGFGRTISKKSIDMAVRHMDIRNGCGGSRPLPSTSLFPQSVRSIPSKIQAAHGCSSPQSISSNGSPSVSNNGFLLENGTYTNGSVEDGKKQENGRIFGRLSEADMYASTRYDALLLKEDLKNTTWLHSMDDKSDQFSIFDGGFEHLPEPFGLP